MVKARVGINNIRYNARRSMKDKKEKNVLLPRITSIDKEIYSLEKNIENEDCFSNIRALNCDMNNEIASHVEVSEAVFKNINFRDTKFPHVELIDVRFENCDLSNSSLNNGILHRVEMKNCKLIGMDLADTNLQNVTFNQCNGDYSNISFSTLKNMDFIDSSFNNVIFENSKLSKVNFINMNMVQIDISKAMVKGIDFTDSNIEGIIGDVRDLYGIIVTPMQALSLSRILGIVIKE